jgi:hypothetical protein
LEHLFIIEKNEFNVFGAIKENDFELPEGLQWDRIYSNNLTIEIE